MNAVGLVKAHVESFGQHTLTKSLVNVSIIEEMNLLF